jgi:hypothetical protein
MKKGVAFLSIQICSKNLGYFSKQTAKSTDFYLLLFLFWYLSFESSSDVNLPKCLNYKFI